MMCFFQGKWSESPVHGEDGVDGQARVRQADAVAVDHTQSNETLRTLEGIDCPFARPGEFDDVDLNH